MASALINAARKLMLRARLAVARSHFGRSGLRSRRFLVTPPQLYLSDPSIAEDLYAGQVVFAGRSLLTAGRLIFDLAPPSAAFARELHGFSWLRHFDASESTILRDHARMLFRFWLDRREQGGLEGVDDPDAIARRVIALVTHSGLLMERADYELYARALDHLARDAAALRLYAGHENAGMLRLRAALALMFHALCLEHSARLCARTEQMLIAALKATILEDGGPRDRSGASAAYLAADLIPLLAVYRARNRAVPGPVGNAFIGLVAFLRLIQHPDGGLALFHGGSQIPRDLVGQVTRFDNRLEARVESAPQSGFERIENANCVLIIDAGSAPDQAFAERAGAAALAFEFSTRTDRLIVSCGLPRATNADIEIAYRSSAAHSSILLDDISPAALEVDETIFGQQSVVLRDPSLSLAPSRERTENGERFIMAHAGYRDALGYLVERRLTLLDEGGGLMGLDRLIASDERAEPCRLTIRFHLHPKVVPVPLLNKDAVMLRLPQQEPGQDMWLFEAPGLVVELDESRCFEEGLLQAKTQQIVIDLPVAGTSEVAWRLVPYRPS